MNTAIVQSPIGHIERVLALGDLSRLSADDRVTYYQQLCESLGLNPLTRPFEYLELSGKLVLYARKDATEQLRRQHGVSVEIVDRRTIEGVYIVTARATLPDGRTDESTGAVALEKQDGEWKTNPNGKRYFAASDEWKALKGEEMANALMKAETKAKRRVTLSICGLGFLDETEVETIPNARPLPAPEPATVEALPVEEEPTEPCARCGAPVKARAVPLLIEKAGAVLCKVHYAEHMAAGQGVAA